MHKLLIVPLLLVLLFPSFVLAQIAPDGVQRYFRAGERPIKNIKVSNRYKDKNFRIDVKIMREYDKNLPTERIEETDDFMIAPNPFILRADSSRLVRLVYTKPLINDEERVYSLRFVPKMIGENDEDLTTAEQVTFGVSFVQTSGMLLLVSPKNPKPELTFERTLDGITINNVGNVSLDFRRQSDHCKASELSDKECIKLPAKRIYPSREFNIEFPLEMPLSWYYTVYDRIQNPLRMGSPSF